MYRINPLDRTKNSVSIGDYSRLIIDLASPSPPQTRIRRSRKITSTRNPRFHRRWSLFASKTWLVLSGYVVCIVGGKINPIDECVFRREREREKERESWITQMHTDVFPFRHGAKRERENAI